MFSSEIEQSNVHFTTSTIKKIGIKSPEKKTGPERPLTTDLLVTCYSFEVNSITGTICQVPARWWRIPDPGYWSKFSVGRCSVSIPLADRSHR